MHSVRKGKKKKKVNLKQSFILLSIVPAPLSVWFKLQISLHVDRFPIIVITSKVIQWKVGSVLSCFDSTLSLVLIPWLDHLSHPKHGWGTALWALKFKILWTSGTVACILLPHGFYFSPSLQNIPLTCKHLVWNVYLGTWLQKWCTCPLTSLSHLKENSCSGCSDILILGT